MVQNDRNYYLDWLSFSAFGILILLHALRPFNNFEWIIASDTKSFVADFVVVFIHTWRLYLIFFISGIGTWITLNSNCSSFINNRLQRLIIPFAFATIVIVPWQYFYQLLQQNPDSTILGFMVNYPNSIIIKGYKFDIFLWIMEIGIHLWYLPSLFIMTIITLPLLKRINEKGISEAFLLKMTKYPKLALLFAFPIIILLIFLKPIFPEYTSVTDFLTYLCSFIFGFVFIKEESRFLPIIHKNRKILLALGILSYLMILTFPLDENFKNAAFNPKYNIYHVIVSIPLGLSAFCWPLYFVILFSKTFNFNIRILSEMNRSILPTYILHQSIIVVVGYYIIKYIGNGFLQFILIIFSTAIISIIAYYFINFFKTTRFLFGMKN